MTFAAVGHTIIGDYTYSCRLDTAPYRMMLHSYHLHIPTTEDLLVTSTDPFIEDSKWKTTDVHLPLGAIVKT